LLSAGAGHYAAGRLDEARPAYEAAAALDPDDFRARYSLAVIDIRTGRLESARAGLRAVVRRQPDLLRAQQNLGAVCETLQIWPEAIFAYRRAIDLDPTARDSRFGLARCLTIVGRTSEAIACYRLLAADPASRALALTRLAILDPSAVDPRQSAEMTRAAGDATLDAETRAGLHFALGRVFEASGAFEAAFGAFKSGNALKRRALAEDSAATGSRAPGAVAREHDRAVRVVKTRVTKEFIARHEGRAGASATPIFIVGMPRSGSSLIEQILSSHRDVAGLGESGVVPSLLEDGRLYDRELAPGSARVRALREAYLVAARRRGWKGQPRFVDKTLENYLHVGMIDLMFPRAVILHSVRNPLDTCVACYRQLFARGAETLYDLADIGAEYLRVADMMAHWRSVLPGRVIEVSYEDLVASPQERIRWLVTEACGLDWDPACLRFHQSPGAVRTASASQVRKPLFTSSVGRWRAYDKHLDPLRRALAGGELRTASRSSDRGDRSAD
jgi:tetratricopeptide (TPR) repeat protein